MPIVPLTVSVPTAIAAGIAIAASHGLLLTQHSNCITIEDTNGNRKLLKQRYEQKIDPVAAMMDAYVAWKLNREAFE